MRAGFIGLGAMGHPMAGHLADRGLLAPDERKSAHAEAARRLLSADSVAAEPWTADPGLRRPVLVAAILAPLAAIGLYLAVGAPGLADQPIAARIAAWRISDPAALAPPELAAVLRAMVVERPNDPEGYRYLAIMEGASDNPTGAARALRRAITLAPQRADLWEMMGEALVAEADGQMSPEARRAFEEALKRDPKAASEAVYRNWAKNYADDKGQFNLHRAREGGDCEVCGGTGYKGRIGLHELMVGTDAVKKLIQEHARVAQLLAQALEDGMRTLKQDGMEKVLQGITDMKQVRAVCIK